MKDDALGFKQPFILPQFASLAEAQAIIEAWRFDFKQRRHYSSLEHLTSNEFVA